MLGKGFIMINGINHVTISVCSIERAFLFYRDVLGLKPIMKSKTSAYFLAGDTWIALTGEQDFKVSPNYSHIAFSVDETEFEGFDKRLKCNNVSEWKSNTSEGESLYILDDSGNKLEIHYSSLENRLESGKQFWGKDVEWYV